MLIPAAETTKQEPKDELLRAVNEAITKILTAVYLALFALVIFLGLTFAWSMRQTAGAGPGGGWSGFSTSALLATMMVLLALSFYLGREWERRRPRRRFKMIRFPKDQLLWKGFLKDGTVEQMPYCPEHSMRLFMRNNEYHCPKCGSERFEAYKWPDNIPNPRFEQIHRGAVSILQGYLDNKAQL